MTNYKIQDNVMEKYCAVCKKLVFRNEISEDRRKCNACRKLQKNTETFYLKDFFKPQAWKILYEPPQIWISDERTNLRTDLQMIKW
jgi:acetyl-CoA carboxylase beta subunit